MNKDVKNIKEDTKVEQFSEGFLEEINKQELVGENGAGWWTAIKLSNSGRCGSVSTLR